MSAPADTEVAVPIPAATDDESALFVTANNLLGVLTTRLKDRPHGQISLVQLPDVFLIKAHLEQLVELEAKRVKHQEILVQMAMDREEEGSKGSKKRVKNTGTQATAMRQAVGEEVEKKTADLQRCNVNLEDRLKKTEKLLESSSNDHKCLADKYSFLASDLNKFIKAPKAASQQTTQSLLDPLHAKIKGVEDKVTTADIKTRAVVKCIQEEHETVLRLCKNDKINDSRHEALQYSISELSENQERIMGRHSRANKERKAQAEQLDDQEKTMNGLRDQVTSAGEKLNMVITTVDTNAWILDRIVKGLIRHIRFLQSRLQITMMPLWDRSDRIQRIFDEDEDDGDPY